MGRNIGSRLFKFLTKPPTGGQNSFLVFTILHSTGIPPLLDFKLTVMESFGTARIYEEEMIDLILTKKFEEMFEIEEILSRSRFSIENFGFNN